MAVAQDLEVERGTLRQWLARYGTERTTGADGRQAPNPLRSNATDVSQLSGATAPETASEVIARLEPSLGPGCCGS